MMVTCASTSLTFNRHAASWLSKRGSSSSFPGAGMYPSPIAQWRLPMVMVAPWHRGQAPAQAFFDTDQRGLVRIKAKRTGLSVSIRVRPLQMRLLLSAAEPPARAQRAGGEQAPPDRAATLFHPQRPRKSACAFIEAAMRAGIASHG